MALDKTTLKTSIKQAFVDQRSKTDSDAALDDLVQKISDAIDVYVKSGTVQVTVASGIAVSTTGTATAQTGATIATGIGTGSIS